MADLQDAPSDRFFAQLADGLAAGQAAQDAPADRFFGTVRSVNSDGTLTVESGVARRTSVRALQSYSPRAEGDVVLVVLTSVGPVVEGVLGRPAAARAFTLSDASAPGGQGWEEVVSGQVWAKGDGSMWVKRTVSLPPPTGGTVAQSATAITTYRGGSLAANGKAEQGDYTGRGLCTGLVTFGSWGALSGHTATGGVLTIHRSGSGHGFTYGQVTAIGWRCVASGQPASPPGLTPGGAQVQAALNETRSVTLPGSWCQDYCTGAATAVAFYSDNARDNIEIDAVTLSISY